MNRLHVPRGELLGTVATITGDGFLYLRDVLRIRVGEAIEIFDGEGRIYPSTVLRYDDDAAQLTLGTPQDKPFSGVRVTIAQGLPKGDKLELIVQKAVELGVTTIAPLATERAIVKLDAKKAAERVVRWQKIADEAARQSGRADVAVIAPVLDFQRFVMTPRAPDEVRLLLDEEEKTRRLRETLTNRDAHYIVLVGPEGGFSRAEVELAKRAGYLPVTLGPRILRTETVALAVLSVVQHVLGDLG